MSDLEKLNHNHEDGCDCGCHDHDDQMMTLVLEDDSELHCHVIGIFDALDRQYIALLPEGDEEALIYRYAEVDNEEGFELSNIDSDEEFEEDEEEYEEEYEDEEEE